MQVSVESTSALERRMKVQVPAEKIDQEVESRLKRVGKTAKLNGFRKGKIPYSVIKKRFGAQVHQEVLGEMIQSTYSDALREQSLIPAGQPSIEPASMDAGKDLEYTAVFEVYPEVKINTLDGLKIERKSAEVKDSDLDKMIETLRSQRASWEAVERAADEGDRVTIDFVGSIDGEEFEGGKADDYQAVIGSGQLLPDLEQGLKGLKSNDEKTIAVNFPDDYHADTLAGKTAKFAVTAKAVEQKKLPEIDEEFIQGFGIEKGDLEAFRSSVKDNMNREMDDRLGTGLRQQVLDALWDANTFELPNALVDQEIQHMHEESMKRIGITDPAQMPEASREQYEDQARRRVGLGLLLNEVITQEKIKVDGELVDKKLAGISANYDNPEEVIQQYRTNQQLMHQIEMLVMEEQVVDLLVAKADVTDAPLTFDEVMGN